VHGVHPDVVLGELVGEDAHEADQAVLGGGVRAEERQALEPGGRAGQDDRPAPGRDQVGRGELHGVPRPGEVDVDGVAPDLRRDLVPAPQDADAGVRHHDVEPAQLGHAGLDRLLERVPVPHVRLDRDDPPVERLDLLDRLGEVVGGGVRIGEVRDRSADVDGDDVGALLRQPYRVAAALATGGTGDEGDLACDTSHGCSLRRAA